MHNCVARTLTTVVAMAAMAAMAAGPAPLVAQVPPDTIAQGLIALEQQWNDAILRNDRTAAAALMAEEWTEITSDGSVLTRAEDLDELIGGYHATSLRLSDIAVHIYDNAAVASGISDEQSSYRGKDTSGGPAGWTCGSGARGRGSALRPRSPGLRQGNICGARYSGRLCGGGGGTPPNKRLQLAVARRG